MQIAGNKCRVCERSIVLSSEGKFCPTCGTFAHLACDELEMCEVCGQAFRHYEPPKPDPMREAIVPRGLRSVTVGQLAIALLLLLPAILFLVIWWLLMEDVARGH
jgi:hypothetical protein